MYNGIYGTLEKDLINIGAFKEYKLDLINKIDNIKTNKRKMNELDKALTELCIYSQWFWFDMMTSLRSKRMIYYRLYNIFGLDKVNQFEMYFINEFVYNRMKELVKNNGYKIEMEEYYV